MLKISRIKLAPSDVMTDDTLSMWLGKAAASGLNSRDSLLEGFTAHDLLSMSLREEAAKLRIQSLEKRLSELQNLEFEETDQFQDARQLVEPSLVTDWTWCHPGDRDRPVWLLMFDDTERGSAVYYEESEAMSAFARAEGLGWNCHLLSSVKRMSEEML